MRTRIRLLLLPFLLAFLLPQMAKADHIEDTWLYMVTQAGIDELNIEMPIFDDDYYNGWVDDGYVYVTPEGGTKQTLIQYRSYDPTGDNGEALIRKGVDGLVTLHRKKGWHDATITTTNTNYTIPFEPGQSYGKLYFTWKVPANMRGRKLTITWKVHKTGNWFEWNTDVDIPSSSFTLPAAPEVAKPSLMDPMLSYDPMHTGQIMLVYTLAANNIQSLFAEYKEVNGKQETFKRVLLDKEMSGYIFLDADKCYKDFVIRAKYVDSEGNTVASASDPIMVPALQLPVGLTASLQTDGSALLSWRKSHPKWQDIQDGDLWDVQRNTTGLMNADAKWTTLSQVPLSGDSIYTFTDETLLDAYEGQPVYYRIRRASTSGWGWTTGYYAQAALPSVIKLPAIHSATVKRGTWEDTRHIANFTFAFGHSQYDSQGRFVVRTAADWETLAKLINNGEKTEMNVIMADDIDLGDSQTKIGVSGHPYCGTFNGNGHVLTVHYNETSGDYAAPFAYIGNKAASFSNLQVTGTVFTTSKFASGFVGETMKDVTFSNCRSSVSITCHVDGDASAGGFMGRQRAGVTTLTDCLFDGEFHDGGAVGFGGLVGWSETVPVITNCLVNPTVLDIDDSYKSCQTFARTRNGATITNSYFTTSINGAETYAIDNRNYMILRNNNDWLSLVEKVAADGGSTTWYVIMMNDFEVTEPIGRRNGVAFTGTFEGNGHTLVVNIDGGSEEGVAPFFNVKNADIRNLNVQGTVKGGKHASGLVGKSTNNTQTIIRNCHVSTDVYTSGKYAGGIVGHGLSVDHEITDCMFDGTLNSENYDVNSFAGAIIGWEDGHTSNVVKNCFENGTYVNFEKVAMNFNALDKGMVYGGSNCWNSHGWKENNSAVGLTPEALVTELGSGNWLTYGSSVIPKQTQHSLDVDGDASGMTWSALAGKLGSGWQVNGNTVLPVMTVSTENEHVPTIWDQTAKVVLHIDKSVGGEVRYTERRELTNDEVKEGKMDVELITSCVDHDFRIVVEQGKSKLTPVDTVGIVVTKAETGEAARYEYNSNVQLSDLEAVTQQSTVLLSWKTTGIGDYFCITRRDKATDKVDTLETNCQQTTYLDQKPQPQHVYIYTVEGVNNCEGEHVSTITKEGWCEPTGMVRGYIRLTDGTALAGVKVKAEPQGDTMGETGTAMTDDTGFFEIKGLQYNGAGTYLITAESTGEEGAFTSFYANFDDNCNMVTNANLVQSKYYLFSGFVMYDGTSVPVIGAQFERDGKIVHNGSGKPIVTDSQGRFSVSVPQGTHTLRVVKDGHVFLYDGFFTDPEAADPLKHNWQKNMAGHVFWDQTKVMLQGRVVGGDTQGDKPLGQMASTNNLGDSLTIVMQLEGDNASWLVRDQLNASVTERHEDYCFATNQLDTCHMDAYRHRLVIKPSAVTGEYCVPMLPVKYKVTEIYAEGYPTLFQAGKVGETIDLSSYVMGDTATYSRIYHSTPTLAVEQFNMMGEKYMGIKDYKEIDNTGKNALVELWNDSTGYSFGYPVFMANSPIIMRLSAEERYYYNNDVRVGAPDIVHLNGGEVYINNGLVDSDNSETQPLDSLGTGYYRFTPQNTTFTEEGDMALKTLTMTLLYDGTYYDVLPMNGEPIRGYVMASKAKSQGRRVVADGGTYVIDVLRDPPGAGSSAYIESGSKFSYSFAADISVASGVNLSFKRGKGTNRYNGVWEGEKVGNTSGPILSTSTETLNSLPIVMGYYQGWQYDYTFENSQRISTSSSAAGVGRDADVFIGMTQSAIMEDAIAVRAINADTYNLLTTHEGGTFKIEGVDFSVPLGTMKVLAEGVNSKGEKVYLVRDEVVSAYMHLKSTFAHSQTYIEKELLPELINIRNSLMLPMGTDEQTAQQVADQAGHAVYISKVANDDVRFAVDANYYTQVSPTGMEFNDSIQSINNTMYTWIEYLSKNEQEKLEATDKVNTYEVDGRTSISYGEAFSAGTSRKRYMITPFQNDNINIGPEFGDKSAAISDLVRYVNKTKKGEEAADSVRQIQVTGVGENLLIRAQVVLSLKYNYNFGKSENYSKKIGFTLAPNTHSNLVVDVYRTRLHEDELEKKIESMKEAGYTEEQLRSLFFQIPSDDYLDGVNGLGDSNAPFWLGYYDPSKPKYSSFVYRTRGGATRQPYEDERRTKYYNAGQVLDAKTMSIDNLRIWTDNASVSNVPYDEPARFTINLANECEMPAMTSTTSPFNLYLEDSSNPKGAKIMVEGRALTADGQDIYLVPGEVVKKGIEIYPSADFDYEDITLSLYDPNDVKRVYSLKLSAHFVPTAGKVNISLPGDKWIVNTESQYDSDKQQYYMPVRIDGFDVNYRNFDHIELQYKLATQGDKEWVNVCSYYKSDSLMAKATGECKLIEEDGQIMATFWGEADPIEQTYDIRAVNYCRYGNGFLTRSSNILTGIKDTRRPQLFGTPEPEDGVLGIGDDIMLRFSENIAGNYLRDLNNFQVLGQTNSTNISLSTDLRFNIGDRAESMSSRNLSAKSFTVDVMLYPDKNNKDMIFFSHGESNERLELGVTKDHKLSARFHTSDSQSAAPEVTFNSTEPVDFNGLHQVAYVFNSDLEAQTTSVSFYDGSKEIGTFTLPRLYGGSGRYYLGTRVNGGLYNRDSYQGEMLEFRLWNRALSLGELNDYRMKRLTGYELGLMDNYPLNEGTGDYSYNCTKNGGDLKIDRATWKVPDGISMKLDGEKGFRIDAQKFERADYHDYTLMFWFRTTDSEGTLLSNGLAKTEAGYKDHFNFGVHEGMLDLWLGGGRQATGTKVNDGQWHHAALTVSRSRNVGNLFIDTQLKKTFAVDTLGGIHGNYLAAGATYLDANTVANTIVGHIDEIGMYEMALSENIIKATAPMTPTGEEMGMKAYLSFGRNELQIDNSQRLMPTGISLKRYYDSTSGEYTTQRDTLVSQATVDLMADKGHYAPIRALATLENIKYSYVAKDNEMCINLDVPPFDIEKTNVIVTVKDVADLNGNVMASPVTMDLYVYRNPLRWNIKQLNKTVNYDEETTFEAVVQNLSGKTKRFRIEGLPVWMTASQYDGSIGPLGEQPITFAVSPYTNIGDFDEIIYIVGEEGMTEPLPVTLKVRGEKPDWAVADNLLHANITMSIVGQVVINDENVAHDSEDMLAAFDDNHRLMGVTHLYANPTGTAIDGLAYLTVYNSSYAATPLHFEFFDASEGTIYQVSPKPDGTIITFKNDTVMGTVTEPISFGNGSGIIQTIPLKKGWNWVSFNVQPEQVPVKQLLNNATKWQVGDGFEADNTDGTHYLISYKAVTDPKNPETVNYMWDYSDNVLTLDARLMYRFYSNSDKLAYVAGTLFNDPIVVRKGWNRIGYSSLLNLPLGTALAEYTDHGSPGDIIKSQSEFAILTEDATGNKAWKGTLEFLRVGEGYMLKRNADGEVRFNYPQYNGGSRYNMTASAPAFENVSGSSMTVVAVAEGVEVQPGDRLMAYRGAELCGIAEADENSVFYLNVGAGNDSEFQISASELTFTLERDDELIAATARAQIGFKPNAALGTPAAPTAINFVATDSFDVDGWYTLSGIKLAKKPRQQGIYIHNNQKVIIK